MRLEGWICNMLLFKKVILLFSLLLLSATSAFSQAITHVSHYSTAEGLSDNRITDIIRDKEGFMWFASWAGISRFDGSRFITFKSYPGDRSSLKSNRIDQIKEDFRGENLWLRAYDKRIYRFNKRSQQIQSLSEILKRESLDRVQFSKILLLEDGEVWLQSDVGIFLVSHSEGRTGYTIFAENAAVQKKLPSNVINFLYSDSSGNKWVGTKKGAVLLEKSQGKYVSKAFGLHGETAEIAEVGPDLWIRDSRGALVSVSKSLKRIKHVKALSSSTTSILASKKRRRLYCATSGGELYRVSTGGSVELLMKVKDGSSILQVYEDRAGNIWLRSASFGVIRFDPDSGDTQYLLPKESYPPSAQRIGLPIFEDNDSRVWIALGRHLYFYERSKKTLLTLQSQLDRRYAHSSQNITQVFCDPLGVLWVAGGYDGVNKIIFQEQRFVKNVVVSEAASPEENYVRGLLVDKKDRLWIGTRAGSLFVQDGDALIADVWKNRFANKAGIYTMLEDSKGRFWLGTKANGLVKAQVSGDIGRDGTVTQYTPQPRDPGAISSRSIYCLLEDRAGRLWAGSFENGLILITEGSGGTKFRTLKNAFKNYPREGFRKIRHMAKDANGLIWIGTTDGLLIFDPESGSPDSYEFRSYSKKPGDICSLGGNDVQFIFRDSNNDMWVLTSTGGLNLASRGNPLESLSFTNYSVRDGLPSDYLLSCLEDNHKNLWIGTQNGLSKFSISKRKIQNFSEDDGLEKVVFSEATLAKRQNGEIVFGTASGFISFDPQRIRTSKIKAEMAFTAFHVNSQELVPSEGSPLQYSINHTSEIRLAHDQNVIGIDFAVLDFHSTGKDKYMYRLVGFDNVWRSSEGQRGATYTKLPPGSYVFEVRSLNDELYLNTPSRSLRIIVSPPFWKTWWAYIIYVVLFISAALAVRKVTLTVLRLRQKIEVEKQFADLKLNFFTQISHELRTPLTLIVSPSEEIEKRENLTDKGREYINIVLRNAHRMLRLVNHVLDLRKVQSGKATLRLEKVEITGFIHMVVDYFRETLEQRQIDVSVRSSFPEVLSCIDRDKLEIVLYNLIGNAVKFSDDGSSVLVSLDKSADSKYFIIRVKDEGPGIEDSELNTIFQMYHEGNNGSQKQKGSGIGLALSKELVELHGGKIYASNNQAVGSTLTVELPFVDVADDTQQAVQEVEIFESGSGSTPGLDGLLPSILIVEDNAELRSFWSLKFGSQYRVSTASNGLEGLERAKADLPDLILSDVMMPEMDGIQLLDRIKNNESTSHIPVVLLTARSSVESRVQALTYGADYYLTKPVSTELLEAALQTIISRRKTLFNALLRDPEAADMATDPLAKGGQVLQAEEPEVHMTDNDRKFLTKVLTIVEDKVADSQFNIDDIVDLLSMSRSTFYRKLKGLTNFTPVEFVREVRLKKVRDLFDAGEENISTAAYSAGFSSPKYMTSCFKARYQVSPSDYIKAIKHPKG